MQIKGCGKFTLTAQTFDGLITTLRMTAALLEDILRSGDYQYVLNSRLQTDPLERHFGKCRQMSGGRFLVRLRDVQSSDKLLRIKAVKLTSKAGTMKLNVVISRDSTNF